ncbi:MAG: DNA replication/repair protein RecF [Oscillospiraceae bacterium]|nr:DNA replication/repair protein RecF [Oscillospiraceae bacterium]
MNIRELTLENFRNYRSQTIAFDEKTNVIYGDNAQGKTNLLEAMVCLSVGRSPRTRGDRDMIAFDAKSAKISALSQARDREFRTEMELSRGRQKKITVNGVRIKRNCDLGGVLNTVFFCPDDLMLIRDGAAARRRFLDSALCQLRPRYAKAYADYLRAYDSKLRILRDGEERPDMLRALPDFNEQLARSGAVIIRYRAQYCKKLAQYAAAAHGECSGGRESLALAYKTVSTVEDPLEEEDKIAERLRQHQEEHYGAEIASGMCLSGPHKDDIEVLIGGRAARSFSSQGQTRTAALALKLAEREICRNATGEYPVLLLDDVLSELDDTRQEFVLNRISGGQVFITCCEDDRLNGLMNGKGFHIKNGEVL